MLFSTLIGASFTILFNLILIPLIGPLGAAIANTISYFVIWLYLFIDSRKTLKLENDNRQVLYQYGIIILQAIVMTYTNLVIGILFSVISFIILILLNQKEIKFIKDKISQTIFRKKNGDGIH